MVRIGILAPSSDWPSGGIRKLYQHADILNRNGFSATIIHKRPEFRCSWFPNITPVTCLADANLADTDYLVVPEIHAAASIRRFPGIPKVIFNQNCYYTFRSRPLEKLDELFPYRHPEVVAAIVVSEDSAAYLQYAFPGLRPFRIRYGIDSRLFHNDAPKQRQIAFMPRKNREDVRQVINILHARNTLRDFELVPVDGMDEAQVATVLQRALIFLSFGYPEGFSLPPAEAMACGCAVVGFNGRGASEYFTPELAYPVPDGDIIGMVRTVEQVIGLCLENPATLTEKTARAARYIREVYAPDHEEMDVVRTWTAIASAGVPAHPEPGCE